MWYEINNDRDLTDFLEQVCFFHDSCIKEMYYASGAYVGENLAMHPINDRRILRVILQRQFSDKPMIEMEFSGLKLLQLLPNDETYTCEILDSTLVMKNNSVYWCDCGGISETDLEHYDGTMICASKLRWRSIDGHMGQQAFYIAVE